MTRKTIAILVLGGGMLGAFLIARLAAPETVGGGLTLTQSGANDPSFAFGDNAERAAGTLGDAGANLTESVIQRYGEKVLKLNPRGVGTTDIRLPNQTTLDELIQTEITQEFIFEKVFTTRDFQTAPGNTAGAIQNYLERIGEIPKGTENLDFLPSVAAAVANDNVEPLEQYVRATNEYLDHLFTVTVPSDWIGFHVKMANIWQARVELARAILAMEEDPLRAIVALNAVPKTAEEELELLALLKDLFAKAS